MFYNFFLGIHMIKSINSLVVCLSCSTVVTWERWKIWWMPWNSATLHRQQLNGFQEYWIFKKGWTMFCPRGPSSGNEGISEHQIYEFFEDPSSQGSFKAVVQSKYYSDSVEISLPCHLLLGVPQATPHYVANRPLFQSKSETPEVRQEWYLKFINTTFPHF